MTTILGLSGSLRQASFNAGLLRAATAAASPATNVVIGSIRDVPLYNADDEAANGIPPAVQALKDSLAAADGLLLVTPEYNNGIPGVFKNAIDWMSRPANEIPRHFGGKPVALLGASPGGFGTVLSQNDWLPVLRTLGTRHWAAGRMLVARAGTVFDRDGNLTDEATLARLADFMAGFADFIES
ncbi:NADPH-dependent FMN reductase [Mesorhizobium amorphae]|uniref:NADPH-dependent FMN reductase n=1 Tax=Mesorhizobium amorphae TaxID=71433 RepID=UPI001185B009|nr:NADPH-dependent FMN reductase [Mesorhizobium amorphae]